MKIVVPLLNGKAFSLIGILLLSLASINVSAQADDCTGATALTVYTSPVCGGATAGTTIGATQSQVACTGTADDDVWYSFVADPNGGQVLISVVGTGMVNPVFEVFSGTCGTLTSIYCRNNSATNTETGTPPNLINGNTYYVRVHSFGSAVGEGAFTICITKVAAVANDNCAGATNLNPGVTCVNTAGNLVNASNSGIAAGPCGGTPDDDVWYSFVAQNSSQLISLSGIGSAIAVNGSGIGGSAIMEVYSSSNNTCGGILTNILCGTAVGTTLLAQSHSFIVGNTYFVRVYSTNSVSLSANAGFNICVTNPPANNDCAGAVNLNPGATCVNTGGTLVNTTNSGIAAACGGTPDDDVWYSFVAQNTSQLITLSSIGANIAVNGAGLGGSVLMDVFSSSDNTCGGTLSNMVCGTAVGTNMLAQSGSFVVGNTYFVRIYSTNNVSLIANANFNICVTNPPANNECSGAVSLTPGNTCVNTAGSLVNASNSGVAAICGGTPDDDVWYSFVATNNSQLITLSGIGTNIAVNGTGLGGSVMMDVFSSSDNTCAGTLSNMVCGSAAGTNLAAVSGSFVIGNTYFVRIYSANGIGLIANANFNICITNPPANDNCAGAISLVPATTCTTGAGGSQASGNLANATSSGIAPTCGGTADDDVWYSFVAQNLTQVITLSSIGANIAVAGTGLGGSAVMEVFASNTNDCLGTFTPITCGYASGNNLVAYANSLTIGNTYFVRVYSANNVLLNGSAGFNICVQHPYMGAPTLYFGKSFINVTKGVGGGTVETGDVLEIRAAVTLRPTSILDSCAFFDNVPAGTSYIPGSLAILTNEGKVYKAFTDAAGDDAGSISGGAIAINMGYNTYDNPATAFRKGRLKSGNIPTVSGSCVMIVSYRVTVTAALNSIISIGGGTFTYSSITDPTNVTTYNYNQNNVIVYTNNGLCINAYGVNVLDLGLGGDFNGTFGSGNEINRVASPNMPPGYTYTTLTGGRPGDFTYAIPNNTSNNVAGYSNNNNWPKPESPVLHRIFGVWDVIGDHTGAVDPAAGNPAADTTNGQSGGYMLLVNAAYNLDTVFKYPISGLCTNTSYELSFWVRNVCSRCGVDSLGRGASGISVPVGYIPSEIGDSSGVNPNLSFSIDDVNHYTTGNIKYTGEWLKKGFVFRTGPTQTNIVFAIANNAPGGGGNDWALDDISLATCTPNLNLAPSGNSQVCYGNQVDLNCDVISFFDNYVYYQWQVSHDNGATWVDTLSMGTGSPTPSGGNFVYNAQFPSFLADSNQHLVQYRIRVATTPANLYGGCSFFNSTNIIVMVNNCEDVLNANLVSFDAVLKNKHAVLNWKTSNETNQTKYQLQKSFNGISFFTIGTVTALGKLTSSYTFTDPDELHSFAYYRVVVQEPAGHKNSRVKLLNATDVPYQIMSVVNPFREKLSLEISIPQNSMATIMLSDPQGKVIRVVKQQMVKGINQIQIDKLESLAAGTYVLQVITDTGSKSKKIIKVSN